MKSFADITKPNLTIKEQVPNIVVTARNHIGKSKIQKVIVDKIQNEVILPVKSLHENKKGCMIIKCTDRNHAEKMQQQLAEKLGTEYIVEQEELQNPRLKVTGLKSEMSIEEMETDINERNFTDSEYFCTVLQIYKNKNSNTYSAILEVTSDTYANIRKKNNKLYIGHQYCKVYDDININPCFKCGRIGHNANKCRNETKCLRCAGNHSTKDCREDNKISCINCCFYNAKYNTDRDTKHIATDSQKCEYLQSKIKSIINITDYPIRPNITRFLGFDYTKINLSENINNQTQNKKAKQKKNTTTPTDIT